MKVNIKLKHKDVKLPRYATDGSGCFDIRAYFEVPTQRQDYYEDEIANGDTIVYSTGLSFEIPKGHVMMIYSRSGHGFKNSVRLSNCVGVIDSDYRGEVLVKLINHSDLSIEIECGDRIAQLAIVPVVRANPIEVEELSNTKRGSNGFGSTGE